ncbi:MAG: site-specific integrase [Erysipelotrichaceae bacterium]
MAQKKDTNRKWFFYGSYVKDDGSVKQYKRRGFDTKGDAKEAERLFIMDVKEVYNSRNSKTFKSVSNEYMNEYRREYKLSSVRATNYKLDRLLQTFGDKKINLIKTSTIQAFIYDLEKDNLSLSYIEKFYFLLNCIFKFAIEHDYISINPVTRARISKNKGTIKKEMMFWTPEDFDRFNSTFIDDKLYQTFYTLLYYSGMRRGEALALQWGDINFAKKTIKINKTCTYNIGGVSRSITTPKTDNSYRTISVPKVLLLALRSWYNDCQKIYGFNDSFFVFGHDEPIAVENVRRKFKKHIKMTKTDKQDAVPEIRIHDLRHSHVSYLINKKVYDYDIARRMGNTVNMIHNTYAHWFINAEDDIMRIMDEDFK